MFACIETELFWLTLWLADDDKVIGLSDKQINLILLQKLETFKYTNKI